MTLLRIVSLSDDETADSKLFSEYGICLYIEHGRNIILFGTGASALYLSNAERLGIPADKADTLIIPVNTDDCTGGVETAVRKNRNIRIFIREDEAADCAVKENCSEYEADFLNRSTEATDTTRSVLNASQRYARTSILSP